MATIFMVCAVVGGILLILQMLLTLMGMNGDSDIDVGADLPDDLAVGDDYVDDHSSSFFGVLSFRSLTAAMAFFGIGGMASLGFGLSSASALILALACGTAAMFLVAWLMRLLHSLNSEGNVSIFGAVGETGTVYLRIPANKEGVGKVTVTLQHRTVEYDALTEGEELSTGKQVEVVGVVGPHTLEVRSL